MEAGVVVLLCVAEVSGLPVICWYFFGTFNVPYIEKFSRVKSFVSDEEFLIFLANSYLYIKTESPTESLIL